MDAELLDQPLLFDEQKSPASTLPIADDLAAFHEFGRRTRVLSTRSQSLHGQPLDVPTFVNEFWTARQRQANRLHEISYRACFKPQLPRFFIQRLTAAGDRVYDPFMGRGTTLVEAALLGRVPLGCDVNPLSAVLTRPRLAPPSVADIERRLRDIDFTDAGEMPEELLVFYHPDTLRQISALRKYLRQKKAEGGPRSSEPFAVPRSNAANSIDDWITAVALNRLTGHSNGFFSVYTLPPNQAVSVKSQRKINSRRNQIPPRRDVPALLLKKSRNLLSDCGPAVRRTLDAVASLALLLTQPSRATPQIASDSVALIVTSPPFLDVVDYAGDNWLRCWFLGIDPRTVELTTPRKLDDWQAAMTEVFRELHRILRPRGHVAFEVGEVHGGKTRLEEAVLPCGLAAGLEPVLVLINDQQFTKTANCWGVDNMNKGTNTNRVVLFRKN
jgi:hypothetical protein